MRAVLPTLIAFVMLVVAMFGVAACAPPEDPARQKDASEVTTERTDDEGPATGSTSENEAGVSEAAGPTTVAYQEVRGGRAVPRCPECGDVFREGTTVCGSCATEVAPWVRSAPCPQCATHGECRRCGDERPCLACAGDGVCGICHGRSRDGEADCVECAGKGRCIVCRGDGTQTVRAGDFLVRANELPGLCPTCVDGSGTCPDCGMTGATRGGASCATCQGTRECPDCRGHGTCAHDRGDGLCAVCGGSGREVLNAPPPSPGERRWSVALVEGAPIVGRVPTRPAPDVHVVPEGRETELLVILESNVDPLSYYTAMRDHTSLDDVKGRVELAELAERFGFLSLALVEMRRAAADRSMAKKLAGRRRDLESRLAASWIAQSDQALAAGDRHAAMLFAWVAASFAEKGAAASARDRARGIAEEMQAEIAALAPADRARRGEAQIARVARTVGRARARMSRAERRMNEAEDAGLSADAIRTAYEEAEYSAWAAERMVGSDASRMPPSEVTWPEKPHELIRDARRLRTRILIARAVREIEGGRFRFAARLLRRAPADDESVSRIDVLLEEAQMGRVRRGVERAPERGDEE